MNNLLGKRCYKHVRQESIEQRKKKVHAVIGMKRVRGKIMIGPICNKVQYRPPFEKKVLGARSTLCT